MTIQWDRLYDDSDNSYFEAPSPFTDGDGPAFCFRIRQKLEGDRRVWYDDSDAECSAGGEEWYTLWDAFEAFEKANSVILNEIENQH